MPSGFGEVSLRACDVAQPLERVAQADEQRPHEARGAAVETRVLQGEEIPAVGRLGLGREVGDVVGRDGALVVVAGLLPRSIRGRREALSRAYSTASGCERSGRSVKPPRRSTLHEATLAGDVWAMTVWTSSCEKAKAQSSVTISLA